MRLSLWRPTITGTQPFPHPGVTGNWKPSLSRPGLCQERSDRRWWHPCPVIGAHRFRGILLVGARQYLALIGPQVHTWHTCLPLYLGLTGLGPGYLQTALSQEISPLLKWCSQSWIGTWTSRDMIMNTDVLCGWFKIKLNTWEKYKSLVIIKTKSKNLLICLKVLLD